MIFFKFLVFGVFAFPMEEIPDTGMRALARDFSGLQEILFSSESFEKKQNSTLIENSLDSMEQHIRRLREVTFKDRIAFEAEIAFLQSKIGRAHV